MPGLEHEQDPSPESAASSDTECELRLGDLMLRAAVLDPTERESFLQQTLQDPALVAEVRRRLGAISDQLHSTFLGEPTGLAAEAVGDFEDEPVPLTPEERYEIGALLGEGGMAKVHRATDRQLQRTVAIKLLSPDAALSSGALREARAQAQVQHPNVVEVYETGELGGESYIAMQFVEGETLAEVAEDASLDAVVRLAIGAAEGLHAAHRRGLVHRDVKPSNILVGEDDDGVATAYVGDFGIAAGGGDDSESPLHASPLGLAVGTPAYMSIEQLSGNAIDRRADVYGLGVTLYRVFTGRLPFEDETLEAMVTAVRAGEFPAPREVQPSLPVELEAIVLRAMARAAEDRYPSAQAVADDLRRHLDGEVVEAYAASLAYRWTRWGLRNRRLLQVAGVAVAVVLVALVVFTVLTQQAKNVAELRRGQAEEILTFMVGDLRSKLAPFNRLEVLEDVDTKALEYFASVPSDELGDDEISRRSKVLYQIGEVRMLQGDLAAALEAFSESWRLARDLHQRDPSHLDWLFELGQSHFWIGYVHFERGELAEALDRFERYRDVGQRLLDSDPFDSTYRIEVAYGHDNVGRVHDARGEWAQALEQHRRHVAIVRNLAEEQPGDEGLQAELATGLLLVGRTLERLGQTREAVEFYEESLQILERLGSASPENLLWREKIGIGLEYLGVLRGALGELAPAQALIQRQLQIFEGLLAADPDNTTWQYSTVTASWHLARLARYVEDWSTHRGHLERAVARIEELLSRDASEPTWRRYRAVLRLEEAAALQAEGQLDRALAEAQQAHRVLDLGQGELAEMGRGDFNAGLHASRSFLVSGDVLAALGRRDEAHEAWRGALEISKARSAHPRHRAFWVQALGRLDRVDEARAALSVLAAHPELDPRYRRFLSSFVAAPD